MSVNVAGLRLKATKRCPGIPRAAEGTFQRCYLQIGAQADSLGLIEPGILSFRQFWYWLKCRQ